MKIQLFVLLIFIFSCKDVQKNDLAEMNLNSDVKSLKETTYSAIEKFGEAMKLDNKSALIYNFNKQGNLSESIWEGGHGDEAKILYCYNDKGFKSGKEESSNREDGFSKSIYLCDDAGNVIEENIYDANGYLVSKEKFKYNAINKKEESNIYNADGTLSYKVIYRYENSNIIDEIYYNSSGKKFQESNFSYDKDGNEITFDNWQEGYDKSKWKYKYEYDSKNNWIKRVTYINDKLSYIEERSIEYY